MCLAIPGKVEEIYVQDELSMARVNFGGIRRAVCVQCVPEASIGDFVLVHVGFALSVIDEEEAHRQLKLLSSSGELEQS